ncbi:uncharacterized protein LOC110880131 isoform X1 [Helianthus annuus]|uniref:uncharacterized protein LOC110880131 isoform X1 n=1 Tax=Helianthus annuus TaxID=4232 RepID=UPI0016530C6A|nr:uncharacterized protein LOC110880131 isoform X1 [Helianthus annuus]
MFSSPEIAHDLTWYAQGPVNNGKLSHPRDSPSWKLVDNTWKEFGKENRNLRLALSADGINPHKSLSSTYSCWPVILITYNLPSYLCMSRKFMMLTLLISGPNQPGNNIDVYLAPLIADLKLLWETGVKTFDAYKKEYFNLRAILLWTINDFPAYGNLSGCVTKGYYACPICSENTCSQWLPKSKKVCFLGHRRFLPLEHPFRKRKKDFNNQQENDIIKNPLSGEEIYDSLTGFENTWGKKKKTKKETSRKQTSKKKTPKKKTSKKEKESIDERAKLWNKKSIFFELEYWKKLLVRHQLDVMHIEKNVCESVYGTLLNLPHKTKDGLNARQDLEELGIKSELQPQLNGNRLLLPPACYTLNYSEKRLFYDTLSNIKVPDGYCSNFKNLVSDDVSKMNGLKSNDCHVLMQQLLPFAIKGVLHEKVRKTIISLCHFFNKLCSKVVDVSKLGKLQSDIVLTLCLLEKYFPPSFFDVMIHLMVHLVREVRLCGPVHFRWMYPFERYMKTLKGYVRNHHRPEGCIAECYVVEEALEFCSGYFKNMKSIGNPYERVDERICTGKPLSGGGGAMIEVVDAKLLDQAHLYVLRNTASVEPYIEQHMLELKNHNPRASRNSTWLQGQHSRTFISWFKNEVEKRLANAEDVCDTVRWLAKGPSFAVAKYTGFAINEYRFHTTSRDESKTTQCSGVSLVAHAMQIASAKDSNPVYGAVTYFGRIKEIWDLDYRMFTLPVFMCDWADSRGVKKDDFGFTVVNFDRLGHQPDRFILASQAKQVFYVQDQQDKNLSVVGFTPHKMYKYGASGEIDDMLAFDATIDVSQYSGLVDLDDDFSCMRVDGEGILV